MAVIRESAAEWVLMHKHPLTIVEEDGFNFMMKKGMSEWQKISWSTNQNDCFFVCKKKETKLKNLLKKVKKISLIIDLWKSKN